MPDFNRPSEVDEYDDEEDDDPEDYPDFDPKFLLEGAESLKEVVDRLRVEALFLEERAALGWELDRPVQDGYGFLQWTGDPDKRPKWYEEDSAE